MARAINWARYDRLIAQGRSERDIAGALAIPRTTLRRALQKRQGPPAPVQKPVQTSDTDAEQRTDTGAVQRVDIGAGQGFDTGAVQRLDRLEDQVVALTTLVKSLAERMPATPVQTPVQITALSPTPRVRRCAGICGSWTRFARRSPRWRLSATSRPASSCRSGYVRC
jgi:hypothetical protein